MMTTEPSSNYVAFILGQLRCAALRSRLQATEADTITTGLVAGLVSVDHAVEWAAEAGVHLITTSSTAITHLST